MEEYQGLSEEVNFMSLIYYILEKWRWIIVSMLIFALLSGGYKYRAVMNANQSEKPETKMENTEEPVELYEEAIQKKESDLEQQEKYLSNSTVMNMDSHNVSTGTLNYHMESGSHSGDLLVAYVAYISGGELAEQLHASDADVSTEDLQYLISFIKTSYAKGGAVEKDDIDDMGAGSVVFQIQVRMPDSDLCETYLNHAEELIEEYSAKLKTQVADHDLTLLSSVQMEMTDEELRQYQSDIWSAYMKSVSDLETLQNKSTNVNSLNESIAVTVNPTSSAVKYAILGLALGAFFACFVLMLVYLLGGRLQNTEDFKTGFGMPLLGIVRVSGRKKKLFGFIDNWIFRLREKSYAKIGMEEQIRMAAVNALSAISRDLVSGNLYKVMLAGTISEEDVAALYGQLKTEMEGISCSSYMQIVFQSSALKELDNYDGVLFLEKRGVSLSKLIVQEKRLASERGVKVLGTIVVC